MSWRAAAGWLCTLASALPACSVQDTQPHCASSEDCAQGEECYLGFCVEGDAGRRTAQLPVRGADPDDAGDRDGGQTDMHIPASSHAAASCTKASTCYDGPPGTEGVGVCHAGQRACEHGVLGPCQNSRLPQAETCANEGADNDCNGVDDDVPRRGEPCNLATAIACAGATLQCGASLQCMATYTGASPAGEDCNARDDDCDGKIDETFDLQNDPAHCGSCNSVCHAGESCAGGQCEVTAPLAAASCGTGPACTAGRSCCAGQCTDLTSNAASCGACGHKCAAGDSCCGGRCVDEQSDAQHCGSCSTQCTQGSLPGCCDGACADLSSNDNCGQCGHSCGLLSGLVCSCLQDGDGTATCRSILLDLCI